MKIILAIILVLISINSVVLEKVMYRKTCSMLYNECVSNCYKDDRVCNDLCTSNYNKCKPHEEPNEFNPASGIQ